MFSNAGCRLTNAESGGRKGYTISSDIKERIAETLRRNHDDPNYKLEHSRLRGGKPIKVFNVYGKFVGNFEYASQACDKLGISRPHMSNVLNGSKALASGYIGIYLDEFSKELLIKKLSRVKQNPFGVIDMINNKKYIFKNRSYAVKILNIPIERRLDIHGGYRLVHSRYFFYSYLDYKFKINESKHANIIKGFKLYKKIFSKIRESSDMEYTYDNIVSIRSRLVQWP